VSGSTSKPSDTVKILRGPVKTFEDDVIRSVLRDIAPDGSGRLVFEIWDGKAWVDGSPFVRSEMFMVASDLSPSELSELGIPA
jgi:hypothetical protein